MRGLGKVFKGAVLLAGLVGVSATALAQKDPRVPTTFNQLVPTESSPGVGSVSQSKLGTQNKPAFNSQVTYKFTIENNTTSDLARSFLRASVYNATSTAQSAPSIDEALTDFGTCTIASNKLSVTCDLGTTGLLAPRDDAAVYIVVNVPYDGQQLGVFWQGGGYEGNGGGGGCCQPSGTYLTAMSEKTTDSTYSSNLQSFLNKKGGKFFTGDAYTTTKNDKGTTFVDVKPLPADYDTSNLDQYYTYIVETLITPDSKAALNTPARKCADGKRLNNCFRTELTIPKADLCTSQECLNDNSKTFPVSELLDIVVRLDASAVRPSTKPEDIVLKYDGAIVLQCAVVPVAGVPSLVKTNLPCWTDRFQWGPSSPYAGYTTDLNKDVEFRLKNYKNGIMEFE